MPTGYTAIIDDNPKVSFSDFVLRCARGMGACITMREEPNDTPIPERFEPSDYYRDRVERLRGTLARLSSMSDADAQAEADAEYERRSFERETAIARDRSTIARYARMAELVAAWMPPTPDHGELKRFMLSQLETGRPYDLSLSWTPPEKMDGPTWRAATIETTKKDLANSEIEWAKEVERVEGRNRWIAELRANLADKAATK